MPFKPVRAVSVSAGFARRPWFHSRASDIHFGFSTTSACIKVFRINAYSNEAPLPAVTDRFRYLAALILGDCSVLRDRNIFLKCIVIIERFFLFFIAYCRCFSQNCGSKISTAYIGGWRKCLLASSHSRFRRHGHRRGRCFNNRKWRLDTASKSKAPKFSSVRLA